MATAFLFKSWLNSGLLLSFSCCMLYICFNLAHSCFCNIDWHRRPGCMSCGILSGYSLMVLGDSFVPWTCVKFEWVSESRSVISDSLWPRGLYSPWNSPGQNTGVGSLSLLQGIFPSQESNPGLPRCGQILYQLSHKGSRRILEWVAYPFSRRSSWPRNRTGVSCVAGRFFTNWAIREACVKIKS